MKNIHILPTDKPSRLYCSNQGKWCFVSEEIKYITDVIQICTNYNIYITDDSEIKMGDWVYCDFDLEVTQLETNLSVMLANDQKGRFGFKTFYKIILTTDTQLIQDGVQAIDDEFLEWFVNNPSCEEVEVEKEQYHTFVGMKKYPMIPNYKIIIPKEEPKKKHIVMIVGDKVNEEPKQETLEEVAERLFAKEEQFIFKLGAKWQEEQTIEEVFEWLTTNNYLTDLKETLIKDFNNFKRK